MQLPELLAPTAVEDVALSSGATVALPQSTLRFRTWTGKAVRVAYGGKTILALDGHPSTAELIILSMLQAFGWAGLWVDGARRRSIDAFWGSPPDVAPSDTVRSLVNGIQLKAGGPEGTPDVVAWRGEDLLFVMTRRRGMVERREEQARWLEAAVALGVQQDEVLVVDWDCDE